MITLTANAHIPPTCMWLHWIFCTVTSEYFSTENNTSCCWCRKLFCTSFFFSLLLFFLYNSISTDQKSGGIYQGLHWLKPMSVKPVIHLSIKCNDPCVFVSSGIKERLVRFVWESEPSDAKLSQCRPGCKKGKKKWVWPLSVPDIFMYKELNIFISA